MADWVMPLFTIVVAVALLMETLVIAAAFLAFRRMVQRAEHATDRMQGRIFAMISQLHRRLEEVEPHISGLVRESSAFMHSARNQAERANRVMTETADRLEAELARADRTISQVLDNIDHTGARIRRAALAPMQTIRALTAGIQTGFNVYRIRSRISAAEPAQPADWMPSQPKAEEPSAGIQLL